MRIPLKLTQKTKKNKIHLPCLYQKEMSLGAQLAEHTNSLARLK